LNGTYNSAQVLVHSAAGLLEDEHSEIDDGIDATELLQKHQSHREEQRFDNRSLKQFSGFDALRIGSFCQICLESLKFWVDVGVSVK